MAIQVAHLEDDYTIEVGGVIESTNNTYQLSFGVPHGIKNQDSVIIQLATYSLTMNYPFLLGYHNVLYIDDYTLETEIPWIGSVLPMDSLQCYFVKKDDFLDFRPIDLFDVGVGDKEIKQAIDILPQNIEIEGGNYILNVDLNNYSYQLIDGLSLNLINSNYSWFLGLEVSGAIIGMDEDENLIWYTGTLWCGSIFGLRFVSGFIVSCDWYSGTLDSRFITNNKLSVTIDETNSTPYNTVWITGNYYGGEIVNCSWFVGNL